MLCGSHIYYNLKSCKPHKKKQKKKHQNARFIDEKLKTKSLMFFVTFFSCDLQDFKFQDVNRKAFGARFLYLVDLMRPHKVPTRFFLLYNSMGLTSAYAHKELNIVFFLLKIN